MSIIWNKRESNYGCYSNIVDGVFISFKPGDGSYSDLDSANDETAIVLVGDKKNGRNRYLIFRGDRREELEKLFPDRQALKDYWKEHGGHFWGDGLEDDDVEVDESGKVIKK